MVILGLGANLGDRLSFLRAGVGKLSAVLSDMRVSRVLESEAVLPPGAPPDWNQPFLNMAVSGNTALAPLALLTALKAIERDLGRQARATWAPREIDLDILAMGNLALQSDSLSIPHPQLLERDFALLPLAELVPDWRYPLAGPYEGKTAADIVKAKGFACNDRLRDKGMVVHAA